MKAKPWLTSEPCTKKMLLNGKWVYKSQYGYTIKNGGLVNKNITKKLRIATNA